MKKDFVICICAIVIGACGWVGGKQYDQYQARKFAREQIALGAAAQKQLEEAKLQTLKVVQVKKQSEEHAAAVQNSQKMAAERKAVETELVGCKLSSIMIGSPNIAIINKKGYEPGGELPLPSGRTLSVTAIQAEAVMLSDGQQGYRLALPTARDLGSANR